MSQLALTLFGPPRIAVDGRAIAIKRRKALALLAYLAVSKQSHSRDFLAAMFWPEVDQARARAALRNAIYALNKTAVKEWLLVEAETVSLRPVTGAEQTLQVDIHQFSGLLAAVQAHDHSKNELCPACVDGLTQAVVLYQNEFMAGFTLPDAPDFDEWQFFQANSLRNELAQALDSIIAQYSEQRQYGEAIPYARQLVALDPLHEPAQRALMTLYAQAGQRSAALRQYDISRETLDNELGVEPALETEVLVERIRGGSYQPGAQHSAHAAANEQPEAANPHNLPPEPTLFIGREQELSGLAAFIENKATRLLTIVGPGGIGKTRLALAAAADQLSKRNFPDGIFFVSLAPLSDPEAIIPAIAEAVDYPFQNDQRPPRKQLIDYLRQKSILLLLDNLEQLLSGEQSDGAALVAEILQNTPQLKILTTSRERLSLYQEQLYPLQGLAMADVSEGDPGKDYAAALLFLLSARRRQPDYEIAPADVPYLAAICRLVEGMPLALELAAPWLEMLSMREIAAEITENLDFLETDVRDMPDRHRSMQAVFATSWHTLTAAEQSVFARLSIFRGGFTPEAAKLVCGAAPKTLTGLVNKSLLRFNQMYRRYEIHELLRQYAAERLAASDADMVRQRHSAYFCTMLDGLTSDLKSERFAEGMARIDYDHDNIISAWHWASEQSAAAHLGQAYEALCLYYRWRERLLEGEQLCRLAVQGLRDAAVGETGPAENARSAGSTKINLFVRLLTWQGAFAQAAAQAARAKAALEEAQLLIDTTSAHAFIDDETRALLLLWRSNNATVERYDGEAVELNEESIDLYRSLNDAWGTAQGLHSLSVKVRSLGMPEKALELQRECMAIRQKFGNPREIARSHNVYGLCALHLGRFQEAEQQLNKSIAINRTLGNQAALVEPLFILGISLLFTGKFEECIATNEEALRIHAQQGMVHETSVSSMSIMRARLNLGLYQLVEEQGQLLLPRYRTVNHGWGLAFTLFNLGRLALVRGSLVEAQRYFMESAEILASMSERSLHPDVLFHLGIVSQKQGDKQRFADYVTQALRMALDIGPLNPMRFELVAMALWLADEGNIERAAEFYAAALQSPYIANSRWFEDLAGRKIAEMAITLPPEVATAARARGQARDLRETAQEIVAELEAPKRVSE